MASGHFWTDRGAPHSDSEVRLFLRLGLGSWAETARRAAALQALLRVCVGWGGAGRLAPGWVDALQAGWLVV